MCESFVSLMYHNLVRDGRDGGRQPYQRLSPSITRYFVGESAFREQLRAVCRLFRPIRFEELDGFYRTGLCPVSNRVERNVASESGTPVPAVQITFDDGWRGCVELGGPVLAEHAVQGMLFVTTDLIGRAHFLSKSELQDLPREQFEIGSHCRTHCFLCECSDSVIREELRVSKDVLEQITGRPVVSVSIPNGAVDHRVRRIARATGYRYVFTSEIRRNTPARGPMRIGRVAIRESMSTDEILRFAAGNFFRQRMRQQMLSAPKRLLGPKRYRQLRGAILGADAAHREMTDLADESLDSQMIRTPVGREPVDCCNVN